MPAETFVDEPAIRRAKRNRRLRMGALALFFVLSLAVAKLTGISEYATVDNVRAFMEEAGVLGFIGFVAAFAIGQLLQIPGTIFVGAASIAYGKLLALPASYIGANVGFVSSFLVVRAIGGQPLSDPRPPLFESLRGRPIAKTRPVRGVLWAADFFDRLFRRVLARLDTHPITTIALLRIFPTIWFAPWLTYMLAMSNVKLKDYVLGCMLGIAIPILLTVLFFDWVVGIVGAW